MAVDGSFTAGGSFAVLLLLLLPLLLPLAPATCALHPAPCSLPLEMAPIGRSLPSTLHAPPLVPCTLHPAPSALPAPMPRSSFEVRRPPPPPPPPLKALAARARGTPVLAAVASAICVSPMSPMHTCMYVHACMYARIRMHARACICPRGAPYAHNGRWSALYAITLT